MSSSEEEDCDTRNEYTQMPEVSKRRQIISAVERDDANSLETLLDSPIWYKITDDEKSPLLHIAILQDREEAFDFLLSLPDYPLELVNSEGHTALSTALTELVNFDGEDDVPIREYYALELIEKGADIYQISDFGTNFLHDAFCNELIEVANVLIKKGLDINKQNKDGNTPLHTCCGHYSDVNLVEGVSMLLYYGADPMIRNFEFLSPFELILKSHKENILAVKENLFYYMFDRYTEYDMDAEAFLRAIELDSALFYVITKSIREVVFRCDLPSYFTIMIFTMKTHYLQIIIEKFSNVVEELLRMSPNYIFTYAKPIYIENFFVLMNSKLKSKLIDWLLRVDLRNVIWKALNSNNSESESTILEFICLLLSYGSSICEENLEKIYQRFGYCELFKILLHMDVEIPPESHRITHIMPFILYNVTLDVPEMNKQPNLFFRRNRKKIEALLPYFTIPYYEPRVPLLVELARDVFRRYFIKRLEISNAKQFYTLVNALPISTYHKKIITLEEKLY